MIDNIQSYNASDVNWTQDLQVALGGGMCLEIQESSVAGTAITITCRRW